MALVVGLNGLEGSGMNTSFFGELLQAISERGRALIDRTRDRRGGDAARSENLIELCEELLSGRGEASGVALAGEILAQYAELTTGPRIAFFEALAQRFGPDRARIAAAVAAWVRENSDEAAAELHAASEPRRQELLRRLNLAPGGTAALVAMREQLMDALERRDDLEAVDADFVHLFSSWFNRGFLVLRRIDWSAPAIVLEKIIRYEAVHEIRDWTDLRRRIDPPDRRCYAFFHPALIDEPLIFVEVALTGDIADAIAPILAAQAESPKPERATTAVFYSISNCQRGLAGVSFGHFLIKQVVEEISRENPRLSTFVTLSPAPGFASWLARERAADRSPALTAEDRARLAGLDQPDWWRNEDAADALREPLLRAAAAYFLSARTPRGQPLDPVARFHLGNGARLEQLDWLADVSAKGLAQSHGLMVNYLYDLDHIEKNHEAYAASRTIVASNAVRRLARHAPVQLVPAAAG
jgi:malonyl-CoA decarboxylase